MKKAVVTILGLAGGRLNHSDNTVTLNDKVVYSFDDELKETLDKNITEKYLSTFPLLINIFSEEYEIIPVFTKNSKKVQTEVLKAHELDQKIIEKLFDEGFLIEDESDFSKIFQLLDEIISKYNRVIVDVTHGFRHLPLLMMIDLIIHNITEPVKIEHILFGKEIVPYVEYEIVDLFKYLDIANIAYALSCFYNNFTITTLIKTKNKDYQNLIDTLNEFSKQILANSVEKLFFSKESTLDKLINNIIKIKGTEQIKPFKNILEKNLKFFQEIKEKTEFKKGEKFIALYKISEILIKRGYYHNSLTLLLESLGLYIIYLLHSENNQRISDAIKTKEQKVKKKRYFELIRETKNAFIVSKHIYNGYLEPHLFEISSFQKRLDQKCKFTNFISNVNKLRNAMSHASVSADITNLKEKIEGYFNEYKKIVNIISFIDIEK